MAISLGYIVYLLGSLLISPISDLFHGRDHVDLQLMSNNKTNKAIQQSSKALFVFGDSLFEAGNERYLAISEKEARALFWPYGETFFHFATGRFSDGRTAPDFIAKFAGLPMIPPYLQPDPKDYTHGISFASAAAGVLATTNPNGTMNLGVQFDCFKNVTEVLQNQLGDEEATSLLERAVYLISMGGVDYASFYATYLDNATDSLRQEYVQIVVGNLTMIIRGMYELGARKIAIQNVENFGCTPKMKKLYEVEIGDGCVEGINILAQQHNFLLVDALKELESQLPGFKYSIFDYYHAIEARNSDPKAYGFKDGENGCCGYGAYRGSDCGGLNGTEPFELCSNPADFLYWDEAHKCEKGNFQTAMLIWNGTGNVTGPYNVQQLFEQD